MPIEPTPQGLIRNTDHVARELAPAGRRSRPKKAGTFLQKTAAPPSKSTLPGPESWALRRLVYSPSATLPPSYTSLRHCLQLRQNPPACAPCPWLLSFPCHRPSMVGLAARYTKGATAPNMIAKPLALAFLCYGGLCKDPFGMPGSFHSGLPTF